MEKKNNLKDEILELEKKFPNDYELGREVRKLVKKWKDIESSDVNPNRMKSEN